MINLERTSENRDYSDNSFEEKKQEFFIRLGLSVRDAFKMHKKADLWGEGEEDWRRVSRHCLVESARVNVLSDLFKLPEDLKKDLISAAAIHDFYKKKEMDKAKEEGLSWKNMKDADKEAENLLMREGFSEIIIKIVGSVGSVALKDIEEILDKKDLSIEDIACLIMHYVDDISIEDRWVTPAEVVDGRGKINVLDVRLDRSDINPKYSLLNEEGKKMFGGKTTYEQHRYIGQLVEKRIASLLGIEDSKDLPEIIDKKIKEEILNEKI